MTRPLRILVAGSPGFIGRHIVRAVREIQPDALLFSIGRTDVNDHLLNMYLSAEVTAENLEVIQRYVAANRPDAVVNCLGSLAADHELAIQSNLRTTEVLIQAVSSVVPGVEFVHLGSAAEYSPLKFPAKTDESAPPQLSDGAFIWDVASLWGGTHLQREGVRVDFDSRYGLKYCS